MTYRAVAVFLASPHPVCALDLVHGSAGSPNSAKQGLKRQRPNVGREKGESLDDGGSEKEEQMEEEVEEEEHRDGSSTEEEEQPEPGDTKREGQCERMPNEEEGRPEHVLTVEEGRPGVTEEDFGRTPSGRVRRRSAQVAVFHLQEIAEDELASDWGGRRHRRDDLVPDSRKVRPPVRSCRNTYSHTRRH